MKKNLKVVSILTVFYLLFLISYVPKEIVNAKTSPFTIIQPDNFRTIYKVRGNELEMLNMIIGKSSISDVNFEPGIYKFTTNLQAILKVKKLDPEQAKTIAKQIESGTYSGIGGGTTWDQARTVNFTVTQYFREVRQTVGSTFYDYTHFDTTKLHINYKDPQVFASAYFEYITYGYKYIQNSDGSFTSVGESRYDSGKDIEYYGITQGSDYYDCNKERLWTDCAPSFSFEISRTVLNISAVHSSWSICAQVQYRGGALYFDTYTN